MDELVDLLAGLGLEAYAERLDDFGIASVGDLGDEELITDEDLMSDDIGMKKAHVRKLRRRLGGGGASPARASPGGSTKVCGTNATTSSAPRNTSTPTTRSLGAVSLAWGAT